MEKRRKRQVLDGNVSRCLNSVCMRLACLLTGAKSNVRQRSGRPSSPLNEQHCLLHSETDLEKVVKINFVSFLPGWLAAVNEHLFQAVRKTKERRRQQTSN